MRVGTQNKTTDPRFCATTALSHCPCWFTAPCFQDIKGQPTVITVVTTTSPQWTSFSTKTQSIANLGCFPWTSQANNYSANRKCPSDSPLLRVFKGSVTAPLFLAYSHSSGSPFCSGYPKPGRVPPPPRVLVLGL